MEDVLDLYHEEYDPERPVVCFDETSKLDFVHSSRVGGRICEAVVWRGWDFFTVAVAPIH